MHTVMRCFTYYTPYHKLASYLQTDFPNGIVHYFDSAGNVLAYWRV